MIGHYCYLAAPPPPRKTVARLVRRIEGASGAGEDQEARFYGRGGTEAEAGRDLAAMVSAWDVERVERALARAQAEFGDCERLLEDFS